MIEYSFSMAELEYFLLILTRVTCFIFIAPFYGMSNTPNRIKIGLGVFVSILLAMSLPPHEIVYHSVEGYAVLVLKEAVTGFLIGFGAQICMLVTSFAGQIVDMDIGLSMATIFDPTTKEQISITGAFYQYMFMLMLITTGMYQYLLKALMETYELIPVSGAVFREDSLLQAMLSFISEYIVIGFRICLPVFIVILLMNVILGVLAKVSPQLNMFSVGIQIKILVGLSVLFLTVSMLPDAAELVFTEMRKMIVAFVEGMM